MGVGDACKGSDSGHVSDRGAADVHEVLQNPGAGGAAESVDLDIGTVSSGPSPLEPVASSLDVDLRDQGAESLPGCAAEDGSKQAAGNPPAVSAATVLTTTRVPKKLVATYNKGSEDK